LILTAAIRFELGDHHTYEFVEGHLPAKMSAGLQDITSSADEFFAYTDNDNIKESCDDALDLLDAYLEAEGPFDGVLAFSQGASIVATYIARRLRQNPELERTNPAFKCAIFFSASSVFSIEDLRRGELREMTGDVDGEIIHIPTAHIWGSKDKRNNEAVDVSTLCAANVREIYVHDGGHEVPGAGSKIAVKSCVHTMRRVISIASYG